MAPLTSSDYTRPLGRRFPSEVCTRIEEFAEIRAQKSKDLKEQMLDYKININPSTSYNYERRRESQRSRKLTLDMLDNFLNATNITVKEFLEICLEENQNLWDLKDPAWTELTWPDELFERLCNALDNANSHIRADVDNFIDQSLPDFYEDFLEQLQKENNEYGKEGVRTPLYAQQKNIVLSERNIENMSDRTALTLEYLTAHLETKPMQTAKQRGLKLNYARLNYARHYWGLFQFSDFQKICNAFKISPHWVFFGTKEHTILAQKAETERIIDKFTFVPDELKPIIVSYAESKSAN